MPDAASNADADHETNAPAPDQPSEAPMTLPDDTPPADAPAESAPSADVEPTADDAPAAPAPTAIYVSSPQAINALVDEILDPERTRPVIGVTSKPSHERPFVDVDALVERVGDAASVWVLTDPELTWSLTDALPRKIDVYGGAVRVWNPIEAGTDPYPSDHPQWTVFGEEEGARAVELIASYIERIAENPLPAYGTTMLATVTTVRKAGAELDLESGHPAFAGIDHLVQHGEIYHAADVLQVGQEVTVRTGAWHPQAGRISVSLREFAPDPWERLAEVYEPGMVVEGGVTGVADFGAFIELLPGVEGLLHKSKIADEYVNYVDDYVQEGDRIAVVLLEIDVDRQKAPVSLRDVPRKVKPERPASVFPGGPPWLPMPEDDESAAPSEASAADEPSSADAPTPASAASGTSAAAESAAELPDPGYATQLVSLVELVLEHGAGNDAALAATLRDALERATLTFDARLDEVDTAGEIDTTDDADAGTTDAAAEADESAGDGDEPTIDPEAISVLRAAANDLIDALRDAD
jgi:predicted RNA-binding protein with RPS1 domain